MTLVVNLKNNDSSIIKISFLGPSLGCLDWSLLQFLQHSCCRMSAVVFLSTLEFPPLKCVLQSVLLQLWGRWGSIIFRCCDWLLKHLHLLYLILQLKVLIYIWALCTFMPRLPTFQKEFCCWMLLFQTPTTTGSGRQDAAAKKKPCR